MVLASEHLQQVRRTVLLRLRCLYICVDPSATPSYCGTTLRVLEDPDARLSEALGALSSYAEVATPQRALGAESGIQGR